MESTKAEENEEMAAKVGLDVVSRHSGRFLLDSAGTVSPRLSSSSQLRGYEIDFTIVLTVLQTELRAVVNFLTLLSYPSISETETPSALHFQQACSF